MMLQFKKLMLPAVLASLGICATANAEKALMSSAETEAIATHMIVGKVNAIYSRLDRKGNYEYTRHVAEVKVDEVEKGKGVGRNDLVYVRYFSIKWIGKGQMPPGPGSHWPQPKRNETLRFFLAKNAYDGFTRANNDGGYNVIYVNGCERLEKTKKVNP